jgi:hypothetical protein
MPTIRFENRVADRPGGDYFISLPELSEWARAKKLPLLCDAIPDGSEFLQLSFLSAHIYDAASRLYSEDDAEKLIAANPGRYAHQNQAMVEAAPRFTVAIQMASRHMDLIEKAIAAGELVKYDSDLIPAKAPTMRATGTAGLVVASQVGTPKPIAVEEPEAAPAAPKDAVKARGAAKPIRLPRDAKEKTETIRWYAQQDADACKGILDDATFSNNEAKGRILKAMIAADMRDCRGKPYDPERAKETVRKALNGWKPT